MFAFSFIFSAKSSNPKKTGCTTKTTPVSSSAPRFRAPKDTAAPAKPDRAEAKTGRKSDTQTSSSVPQKDSTETSSQPGKLKSSPAPSGNKPLSSKALGNEAEGSQVAFKPDLELKPVPDSSTSGEETHKGAASETTVQSPRINMATEDTSFTEGETDVGTRQEKQEKKEEKEVKKKGETECGVENGPR